MPLNLTTIPTAAYWSCCISNSRRKYKIRKHS